MFFPYAVAGLVCIFGGTGSSMMAMCPCPEAQQSEIPKVEGIVPRIPSEASAVCFSSYDDLLMWLDQALWSG